jgi:hypothetical protein
MQEGDPIESPSFSPSADALQFQTAEFAPAERPRCVLCRAEIGDTYYHLDGSVICKVCAGHRQTMQEPLRGRVFGKSVLYGLGAALAGSALYGIVLLSTGAEFALLSILVGIMVGKAMMHGSGGRGGRKLQIVAVLLTYFGITAGYIPSIVKGLSNKQSRKEIAGQTLRRAPDRAAPTPLQKPIPFGRAIAGLLLALGFVIGFALVMPFSMLTQGFSGIFGIAIIFFGLQRAWHKTRGGQGILMGPYPSATSA